MPVTSSATFGDILNELMTHSHDLADLWVRQTGLSGSKHNRPAGSTSFLIACAPLVDTLLSLT